MMSAVAVFVNRAVVVHGIVAWMMMLTLMMIMIMLMMGFYLANKKHTRTY